MNDCSDNDAINLNFKGIQMRGLSEIQLSAKGVHQTMERHDVSTTRGIVLSVMVQKGRLAKKNMSIVTMHDIGTNFTLFTSFFNYPEMRVLMDYFTVYHICAPGHASEDPNSVAEHKRLLSTVSNTPGSPVLTNDFQDKEDIFTISDKSGNKTRSYSTVSTKTGYPSLDELAEMIEEVVYSLKMGNPIGVGMGAGSNVLMRLAMRRPNLFTGLWLINPNDIAASYWSWGKLRWSDVPRLKASGEWTDALREMLLNHWFGYGVEHGLDIEEYYMQALERHQIGDNESVAGYIDAYLNRSTLGLCRQQDGTCLFKVDTMLVTGDLSRDLVRNMVDMNGNMDPTTTQYISLPDCTGMIMDEVPGRLSVIFLNFLRNLGVLVSMTPDKLQKLAVEVQVQSAADAAAGTRCAGDNGPNDYCDLSYSNEPPVYTRKALNEC